MHLTLKALALSFLACSAFSLREKSPVLEKGAASEKRVADEEGFASLFHGNGDLTKVWPHWIEMQIGESPADKPQGKKSGGRFHSGDLFVLGRQAEWVEIVFRNVRIAECPSQGPEDPRSTLHLIARQPPRRF